MARSYRILRITPAPRCVGGRRVGLGAEGPCEFPSHLAKTGDALRPRCYVDAMSRSSPINALSVQQMMLRLHSSCADHIEKAAASNEAAINQVLHLEADLASWLETLDLQPEVEQLKSAHRDFGLSFYAAMSGLYRQAFSSLRSFLEVTIGAAYLSSHEFKRRRWALGELDISWSSIIDAEHGIYSVEFLDAFCPEVVRERSEMLTTLKNAYRRCSEYIHGNIPTSQLLPSSIAYQDEVCKEWLSVAETCLVASLHSFMIRYYKDLSSAGKSTVEGSLEDHFSHLASVRKLLGLPIEEVLS